MPEMAGPGESETSIASAGLQIDVEGILGHVVDVVVCRGFLIGDRVNEADRAVGTDIDDIFRISGDAVAARAVIIAEINVPHVPDLWSGGCHVDGVSHSVEDIAVCHIIITHLRVGAGTR